MPEPVIRCRSLYKIFGLDPADVRTDGEGVVEPSILEREGVVAAVNNVSLEVSPGETLIVMGLSGSGKSTLVRCLSRLIEPTSGTVEIEGADLLAMSDRELIDLRRSKMGMVFQNFALLPHRTALEKHRLPAADAGDEAPRLRGAGAQDDRSRRARGPGEQLPARAVRRPAAAGRNCAIARRRARHLVSRRAVLRARPAHPQGDAGRVPASPVPAQEDHRLHHPRFRRGAQARGSNGHHVQRQRRADRCARGNRAQPRNRVRVAVHQRRAAREGAEGRARSWNRRATTRRWPTRPST